jgi:thioredoxin 1
MHTNHVRPITEATFDAEVLESPIPVLVDFATAWCPPCRVLAPILDRLAAETDGRIRIASVAADEWPSLAARYGVRGYPTVIAFAGGKERARHLGATSKERLLQMVEECR